MQSSLYYEAHVTIKPVFDNKRRLAAAVASRYKFRLANLLMQKRKDDNPQVSPYDTFMTGHSKDYKELALNMSMLLEALKAQGFEVLRFKIEDTLFDSRHNPDFKAHLLEVILASDDYPPLPVSPAGMYTADQMRLYYDLGRKFQNPAA